MKNTEYSIPDITVLNDFTIVYKSREEQEGEFYDSLEEIKTSKDQFLRKLRFFKSRMNEINSIDSILIQENYPKEVFKEFISTLTTNKISLNEKNYKTLLKLSEKYEYPELQKQVLKYSKSRPDVQEAVDDIYNAEEEIDDFLAEEMIATHLDICLGNDRMLKFPIQKLIRILNSPKRVLNDHHLLFEFIKKFILIKEKEKDDENEEDEYIHLLMSSLEYNRMSTEELKELFNLKYYTNSVNMKGTKEQMSRFIKDIEKQEEKINFLVEQIEKQGEIINKCKEEHQKNQEIFATYEKRMKEMEETIKRKYEEDNQKQQENHKIQSKKIEELLEKIDQNEKENRESQVERIKKIEEKIRKFEPAWNQIKCELQVSVEQNQVIKGVIRINDNIGKLDISRSKYLLNTNRAGTLGRSAYEGEKKITKLNEEMTFTRRAGTYYLHVLLIDTFGNEKEFVSESVRTKGFAYNYEFTGRVESVTLESGKYKLEVWGAEGGKRGNYSNHSGKGGYSCGTLTLKKKTKLHIHVGESPKGQEGGWNGGGSGSKGDSTNTPAGGGGSTDISLYGEESSSNWNNKDHLYSRIIVAGAGGGSSRNDLPEWRGGFGGGISGQDSGFGPSENGGTQTRAGTNKEYSSGQGFGVGGSSTGNYPSGGGGGWYGGGAPNGGNNTAGGSGGSGYVYNASTASYYPNGCKLDSLFYLTDSVTLSGDIEFPNPRSLSQETGHSGHGYARITPIKYI